MKIQKKYINILIIVSFLLIVSTIGIIKAVEVIPSFLTRKNIIGKSPDTIVANFENKYNNATADLNKGAMEIYGVSELAQQKRVYKSNRYWLLRADNGQLYRRTPKNTKVEERMNKVIDYLSAVEKKGVDAAFVMVPPSIIEGVNKVPIKDYANDIADKAVGMLKEAGLPVMDGRDCFTEEEKRTQLYFKTDHHWTYPTAFKIAGETVKFMNNEFDLGVKDVDYLSDLNNYNVKVYKDAFTGAFKTVTSRAIVGVEDMHFISPKFKTSYDYKAYDKKGVLQKETSGTFKEAFCELEKVETTGKCTYDMYMQAKYFECTYHNKLAKNDKKVLVIGTSHARPYCAFLSLYYKDVHYVSMQNTELPMNLYEYVDEVGADAVVIAYSVNSLGKEYMVNFKGADGK